MITKEYIESIMKNGLEMLKPDWKLWNYKKTDAGKGLTPPAIVKEYDQKSELISLKTDGINELSKKSLIDCIENRKSIRKFNDNALTIEELSLLLWEVGGIIEHRDGWSRRTVPSAGARHCLETYIYINKVEEISEGLYRYLPIENKLLLVNATDKLKSNLDKAMFNQMYNSAVTFIWTAIPYRMEFKYSVVAHKMIAFEAGHACQNLYLASEAIDCGCCAISAYKQKSMDKIVKVDGEDEFVIYMAVVGKKS
ncbi:SagB/ThcOx family dehydrogenase [Vallitalea okinawensis]|uniref:SagB/ThcOx family dehydrogenase n=1 Tax=Vallitalea okinawensis TaxID=2078660 RepID=UPI000CFC686B|nr:SagB/ThcOx family dehydrogenase [Vallitalea okinawensis]